MPCRRPGLTLLELLVVLAIVGVLTGLALPAFRRGMARREAVAAAREVALLLSTARQIAATSSQGAAVRFDTARATARLTAGDDSVRLLDLRAVYRVGLRTTRDSVAYDSRGLGYGAANVTIVVGSPAASETLRVSRLGRVRGGW